MNDLLDHMGRPDDGYPIIHVARTNGKTSTSRFATLILVAHGLTTGTHTSPHLQKVEERLAINGRFATADEFALAMSDVAAFADLREERGAEPNTYFELATASAFAFFADQAVNAAVLEVGLGGRLDATNVVDAEVCVVTSIGVDHTEYLGEDIASIAAEKVAIVGPKSILVTGPLPDQALDETNRKSRELGIQHRRFGVDYSLGDSEREVGGWLATIHGAEEDYEDIFLPLHGKYQLFNLSVAVAAAEAMHTLAAQGWGRAETAFSRLFAERMIPGGTREQQQWLADLQRISTSAENAVWFMKTTGAFDILDRLKDVTVPTLVTHSRGDQQVPFEEGRLLAAEIPDARLIPLESKNHLILEGEPAWPRFRDEVRAFIAV